MKTLNQKLSEHKDKSELEQRLRLYTTACIMLEREGISAERFYTELEHYGHLYNMKYHGIRSLANHKDRHNAVMQREKKLTIMILKHYINGTEYEI